MALTDKLTNIADAIRSKGGTTDQLTLAGMVDAINAIQTGGGGAVNSVNGQTGTVELTAEDVGAIAKTELQTTINTALAQAKASGEFDGADGLTPTIGENGNWYLGDADTGKPSRGEKGDTPQKGTDYWTADDQLSIVNDVLAALPTWGGGSY